MDDQSKSSRIPCCPCYLPDENQNELIKSGEIFSWRDNHGMNALLHAATLRCYERSNWVDSSTFELLFQQQVRPYSANEKADALELLGSSYILMGEVINEGLANWMELFKYRSAPRCCVPEADVPPVTRGFTMPQWTNHEDVARMLAGRDPIVNVAHQAMLVRLRFGFASWSIEPLKHFVEVNLLYGYNVSITDKVKLIIMLFEWDTLYGSHSLSLLDYCVLRSIEHFSFLLTQIIENENFTNDRHVVCAENVRVVSKWLVTAFEKLSVSLAERRKNQPKYYQMALTTSLTSVINFLAMFQKIALDNDNSDIKRDVYKIVQTGRLGQHCERSLFHQACIDKRLEAIPLLVEFGAVDNSVDADGNTCLHHLLLQRRKVIQPRDVSLIQLLLNNGAHPDVANKNGITPIQLFNRCSKSGNVPSPFPFPSLKCICAQVLRRHGIDVSNENLPKNIVNSINMH